MYNTPVSTGVPVRTVAVEDRTTGCPDTTEEPYVRPLPRRDRRGDTRLRRECFVPEDFRLGR